MDSPLPFILIFFVLQAIAIVAVIVALVRRENRGQSKGVLALARLGEATGLPLLGGEPRFPHQKWLSWVRSPRVLEGTYGSYPGKIYHFTTGSGKNQTTYCCARLEVPNDKNRELALGKEGFFSKIGKGLGMKDQEVGDPRFDEGVTIRGNDPDFVKIGLIEPLRERILRLWESGGSGPRIELSGRELKYTEVGSIRKETDVPRFSEAMAVLHDLAEAMAVYDAAT